MPIWPHPKDAQLGTGSPATVVPSKDFFVLVDDSIVESEIQRRILARQELPITLKKAFSRYRKITFPKPNSWKDASLDISQVSVTQVKLYVKDLDESHPQLGHDESYKMTINHEVAEIRANTVWGTLHALETFSQLVDYDFDQRAYVLDRFPVQINDEPRFTERGLMLDTARHFETIPTILRLISSLPHAKINVFHWHMSDTESFPMESNAAPNLWKGSYSKEERYSVDEVKMVVEFARLHGVRVIVEFDMPGHAQSWCKGYPEICPSKTCTTPLNVANSNTFQIIGSLFNEVTGGSPSTPGNPKGLFPDNLIHLGGDEVDTRCWETSVEVKKWREARNMTSSQAYAYFTSKVANMAIENGRRPVQWIEVFVNDPDSVSKESIVHIWKSNDYVAPVTEKGLNCILSGPDWYLDHLAVNWTTIYNTEPCEKVADEQCKLVLGGHGEMWGETVDGSDVFATVWPKLAAIAERLWSPRTVNSPIQALPRLQNFRCLLNLRGIGASPVLNKQSRQPPPKQQSCYAQ